MKEPVQHAAEAAAEILTGPDKAMNDFKLRRGFMDTFYEPLLQMETFTQIEEALKKDEGLTLVTGCVDSQKPI